LSLPALEIILAQNIFIMPKRIHFEPGNLYYVRAQTIGNTPAFHTRSDYNHFLNLYQNFFSPLCKTNAFSLLPSQFHFIINLPEDAILTNEKIKDQIFSYEISKAFGKVLSSYTQTFNYRNNRNGSLFHLPAKRDLISDHEQLMDLIKYIHRLPVDYDLTDHPAKWKHSSYPLIINKRASFIYTNDIVSSLPALKKFELFHDSPSEFKPEFQSPALFDPLRKAA
jgi:putative transposase